MFSEEKLSLAGQKNIGRSIGIECFYSNTSYGFQYKEICISKSFIKMLIKGKTRAGDAFAYRMILS